MNHHIQVYEHSSVISRIRLPNSISPMHAPDGNRSRHLAMPFCGCCTRPSVVGWAGRMPLVWALVAAVLNSGQLTDILAQRLAVVGSWPGPLLLGQLQIPSGWAKQIQQVPSAFDGDAIFVAASLPNNNFRGTIPYSNPHRAPTAQ